MPGSITFDISGDFYKVVEYNTTLTGHHKSHIVETIAKHGAQMLFAENLYVKENNMLGLEACKKLKMINTTTRLTTEDPVYDVEEVDNINDVISNKLKKSKKKISVLFEPGFKKFVLWYADHYHYSTSHTIMLLLQYGMALIYCTDRVDDYSEPDRKYFEDIKNHVVHYDPDWALSKS